jgi:hypothetical protein
MQLNIFIMAKPGSSQTCDHPYYVLNPTCCNFLHRDQSKILLHPKIN